MRGYIVKLNDKTYVKGKGYINSLYGQPYHVTKMPTTDISKASIYKHREQAVDIVEEYGGKICEIGLKEI